MQQLGDKMATGVVWLLFLLLCEMHPVTDASGKFYFHMLSYSSDCEEDFWISMCDFRFTFCFDIPRSNPSINTCAYMKTIESDAFADSNRIQFGSNINGISNPMVFSMGSFEDPRVMVVIRLMDEDFIYDDHIITTAFIITFTPAASSYVSGNLSVSGHSFYFEYMAFCDEHFYGPACTTFCVPSNTTNQGSNSCENAGQDCPPGWQGSDCKEDVNECQVPDVCSTFNSSSHVCINTFGSFECACKPGWTGENCDQDLDECVEVTSPNCSNGGKCINTIGSYRCLCPNGNWSEADCSNETDECSALTSPCTLPNSRCSNTPEGYLCLCNDGWEQGDCSRDVDECLHQEMICANNGTCVNVPGSYRCECSSGWAGSDCSSDVNECDHWPCLDEGHCENLMGTFQCVCANQTAGCFGGEDLMTGRSITKEEGFLWWPLVLTAALLLIAVFIILAVIVRRKKRKKEEVTESDPPSAIGANSVAFENSIYNVNKHDGPPPAVDLNARNQLPLPDERLDTVVYQEIDDDIFERPEQALTQTFPYHNVEISNNQIRLDSRQHACNENPYEDFDAVKSNDKAPAYSSSCEGENGGYMDPNIVGLAKERSEDRISLASEDSVLDLGEDYYSMACDVSQVPSLSQYHTLSDDDQPSSDSPYFDPDEEGEVVSPNTPELQENFYDSAEDEEDHFPGRFQEGENSDVTRNYDGALQFVDRAATDVHQSRHNFFGESNTDDTVSQ